MNARVPRALNFARRGWFAKYLAFRSAQPFAPQLPTAGMHVLEDEGLRHEQDEAVYAFVQPTGLLYGFPVGLPFPQMRYPQEEFLDTAGRVHLIFLESLFAVLVADRHYLLSGLQDDAAPLQAAVDVAVDFLVNSSPLAPRGGRWPRGRMPWGAPTRLALLERELRLRVGQGTELFQMPGHFYNSFLFLDLHFAVQWQRRMLVEPQQREALLEHFRAEQIAVRRALLRLMIAAAHASEGLNASERRLIGWFFRSSGLPRPHLAELEAELDRGVDLTAVEVPHAPWLVRRYLLECVLMTLLVDRRLEVAEQGFLQEAAAALELWPGELEQSVTAMEVFLLNEGSRLQFLRNRSALRGLSTSLRERASLEVRRNMHRLMNEIRETGELYALLNKATHTPLNAEEKQKVRAQLLDIMKTIPALAIWALPGGGFALPVIIRLLPFNLLPSSFED